MEYNHSYHAWSFSCLLKLRSISIEVLEEDFSHRNSATGLLRFGVIGLGCHFSISLSSQAMSFEFTHIRIEDAREEAVFPLAFLSKKSDKPFISLSIIRQLEANAPVIVFNQLRLDVGSFAINLDESFISDALKLQKRITIVSNSEGPKSTNILKENDNQPISLVVGDHISGSGASTAIEYVTKFSTSGDFVSSRETQGI